MAGVREDSAAYWSISHDRLEYCPHKIQMHDAHQNLLRPPPLVYKL